MVCGIDTGSLSTPSFVAWLDGRTFFLDLYQPSAAAPLPARPEGRPEVTHFAVDAPQGLPAGGRPRREADRAAGTPTRRLPPTRGALAASTLYRSFITAGIDLFWTVADRPLGSVPGLPAGATPPIVAETYPRYVLRRRWPRMAVPSKRSAPVAYVGLVWSALRDAGYECASVVRPTVDQVDAMLCALAADAYRRADGLPEGTVGEPPTLDREHSVLREGYIISP